MADRNHHSVTLRHLRPESITIATPDSLAAGILAETLTGPAPGLGAAPGQPEEATGV